MSGDSVDLGVPHLEPLETIGRGGFSVVYKALDTKLNRYVAVKVLTAAVDSADLARFDQECQIHGPLSNHPNIVTIHDAGYTATGSPFLVMEYLDEGSLSDHLDGNGPMPWQQAVEWMAPICDAVETAHRMGVLHRDIKPANILISPDGPKLADFGIACVSDATSPQFAVSWHHAPPEAEANRRDERSDVYSLASTTFQLITGHAPFWRPGEDSLAGLLHRMVTEPAPHLSPAVAPAWLDARLQRALDKDPARRPASAAELRDLLAAGPAPSDLAVSPAVPQIPGGTAGATQAVQPGLVVPLRDPSHAPASPVPHSSPVGSNGTGTAGSVDAGSIATVSLLSDYRSPRPAPKQRRRRSALPAVAAVLALALVGFFLSPAWGALQPGNDGPGAAEAETDAGDETSEPTASTTEPTDTTDPTSDTTGTTAPTTDTTGTAPTTDTTTGTTGTTDTTAAVTGEVPNVAGLTVDQAEETLTLDGFADHIVVEEASDTVAEGLVVGTDPSAGTVTELTTTITVIRSTGPELVEVPSVVGRETAEARAILESLGFVVAIERVSVAADSPQAGIVISADPAAGQALPAGSTVTLQVGQAPLPPLTIPPVIGPAQQITTTTLGLTAP